MDAVISRTNLSTGGVYKQEGAIVTSMKLKHNGDLAKGTLLASITEGGERVAIPYVEGTEGAVLVGVNTLDTDGTREDVVAILRHGVAFKDELTTLTAEGVATPVTTDDVIALEAIGIYV